MIKSSLYIFDYRTLIADSEYKFLDRKITILVVQKCIRPIKTASKSYKNVRRKNFEKFLATNIYVRVLRYIFWKLKFDASQVMLFPARGAFDWLRGPKSASVRFRRSLSFNLIRHLIGWHRATKITYNLHHQKKAKKVFFLLN